MQAGAQWRRGEGAWNDSGAREPGILAGTYGIAFMDIVGWLSPSPMEVTVSGTATVVENGLTLYTAMKEGTGAIRVFLQPDTVTPADPKWRRVGTTSWMNAGTAENHVPAGWYDVEFAPIQGWKTPEPRFIRVTEGQTANLFLVFERGSGEIEGETWEGETGEGEAYTEGEGEPAVEQVIVPDVTGKSKDESVTLLEALGFQVIVQEENSKAPKDEVVAQDPAAGGEVAEGTPVTLTVSTGNSGSLCGCGPQSASKGGYQGDFIMLLLVSVVLTVSSFTQRKTNANAAHNPIA